eukprot:c26587_g1_i1 orf=687-3488(-)
MPQPPSIFCWHFFLHWFLLANVASSYLQTMDAANVTVPITINIGALYALNSTIGRVAKPAIMLAVNDINMDNSVLNNSKLVLHTVDTNCSAFQGAAAALQLMKEEVVAIVGPQSSAVSHFIAEMGGAVQVPLVSFAASDPSLSESQYPYFFRVVHTDVVQMKAVAAVVGYYGWREVVAVFTDDDSGTNGISALDDALGSVGARIVKKEALASFIDKNGVGNILTQLKMIESRVFVVHLQQDVGLMLFSIARDLGMMTTGYAWIVTDSMAAVLDSLNLDSDVLQAVQGIIGTRSYIPSSPKSTSFVTKWKKLQGNQTDSSQFNVYGFYAYDSVWMIGYALDSFLKKGWTFDFDDPIPLSSSAGGDSELARLKVFQEGSLLQQQILQTKFNGTSGPVQVNSRRDRLGSSFEIVNMVGKEFRVIGYWANETGISASAPGSSDTTLSALRTPASSSFPQKLLGVIWPGGGIQTPRGWMIPDNGRPLVFAVPDKIGYKQFVNVGELNNVSSFHGFCIDVFQDALQYLPYSVPYTFVRFGNGTTYDQLIQQLADKVFDGVVGDVTITTERLELIDFTQPYTESGLVVVVPVRDNDKKDAWAFLRPFTPAMWLTTGAFFVFTGIVVWVLEHKKNPDFRGRPKKQIVTLLWFIFSTLFFAQREDTKSILGRCVVIIWLFVVLIITSSYTANLTSILTVQQLTPTIQGIGSLQASSVPIGYQTGSFARDYLIGLNIAAERLKPLSTIASYAEALNLGPDRGGVAAIVDELPYIQVFLASQCGFAIAGQEFTKGGWGFAFPKDSELAIDLSTSILAMSESGELQKIYDFWLNGGNCDMPSDQVESSQLNLDSFWGLFLLTGVASLICLIIYIVRLLSQFRQRSDALNLTPGNRSLSSTSFDFLKSFALYVDQSAVNRPERAVVRQDASDLYQSSSNDSMPLNT